MIAAKRDVELVRNLNLLDADIEGLFIAYEAGCISNALEEVHAFTFTEEQKDYLLKLYRFQHSLIQKVKECVMTNASGRKIVKCQYCTINTVTCMDHIMPKTDFPEFVVNYKNLFPCCHECNGYKTGNWLNEEGERQYLNLYLDILPDEQYLFVDVTINDGVVATEFTLHNENNFNEDLFRLIVSHYDNLHLCERFEKSANDIITSLGNLLAAQTSTMTRDQIKEFVTRSEESNKESFGHNYWRSILTIALVNNDEFLNLYLN